MTSPSRLLLATAGLALALPAQAQSLPYGDAGASDDTGVSSGAPHRSGGGPRVSVTPYIEAAQIVTAELSPGNEVLTYTSIAAGVDAAVKGRYNEGAMSLRYERRIGWGKASSGDIVSGLARGSAAIVPGVLTFEAGALAARSKVEATGQRAISADPLGLISPRVDHHDFGVVQRFEGDRLFSGYGNSVTRLGLVAVDPHPADWRNQILEAPGRGVVSHHVALR